MAGEYLGQCRYCKKDFSKRGIKIHIEKCTERRKDISSQAPNNAFHLLIKSLHDPRYWLIVAAHIDAKLRNLDTLIRNTWIESGENIGQFSHHKKEVGMQQYISATLLVGDSIDYMYEVGTSTELVITNWRALSATKNLKTDKVYLEARNYLPEAKCSCGKDASSICTRCMNKGETVKSIFCDKCAKKHEKKDEHYILPIANSPRCSKCEDEGDCKDPKILF